jgi:hypothetical protein
MTWIIVLLTLILVVLVLFVYLVSCANTNTLKELENINQRLHHMELRK